MRQTNDSLTQQQTLACLLYLHVTQSENQPSGSQSITPFVKIVKIAARNHCTS